MPVLLATAFAVWACGTGAEDTEETPIRSGLPADLFPDTAPVAIEFVPATELSMVAGETSTLTVAVSPPGLHTVRFALLGEAENAFVNPSLVETGPDGFAQTSLTALAAASRFTVRAAASRLSVTREVVTLGASQATLLVSPNYLGSRPVASWAASVHANVSCASLTGVPFPDGSLLTTGDSPVRVSAIPAEVPLAVVVRAEHFAGGCRSVPALRANSETEVSIDVMDRPIQTANLALDVSFGVEATEAPNPALDELAFRAVSPLTGGASDDLTALLDAMADAAQDRAAYDQARAAQGWSAALVAGLAPELPGSGLRSLVQGWMRAGIERLEQPGAMRGSLVSLGPDSEAAFTLESVIGLTPQAAGFAAQNGASAVVEMEDILRLGTTLDWQPSPLLAQAATLSALELDPERVSAADAMATQFGCDDVARILVEAGASAGEAFAGCDAACTLALCEAAMGELWSRVAGSNLPAVPWQ
ncbi:MAG TPA: hypothetical protein VNN80_19630, partial [Polyangiaceae bacterium]|nr:hypothetical protein [Polyangiaceae bacterium]